MIPNSSVDNIIGLSKLAMQVNSSLIAAPDDLKRISGQVWSLHSILISLHNTMQNITLSEGDEDHLDHLTQGCCTIISQLETIIQISQSMGKQRFSRTVNPAVAVFADTQELQQKLVLQVGLLTSFQLGLASRGQIKIKYALQAISKAVRAGQRPSSIFEAEAICNEAEEMTTIWFRIESELEGEGVEKSDIEINKGYINGWIQAALAAGSLDRTAPTDAISDLDICCSSRASLPTGEMITRSRIEAISLRIDLLKPKTSESIRSTNSVRESSPDNRLSRGSPHRTQASTRHSMSGHSKEYAHQILLQLAVPDVKLLLDCESRQGLIEGVFHQMQWNEETSISRQEVLDIWTSVSKKANAELKPGRLISIVRSGDVNKDGMIDLKEFIKISEDVVDEIEKSHEETLQDMIAVTRDEAFRNEAIALDKLHLANPFQAPIPWGWIHAPSDSFRDMVSGYETRKLPEIDPRSFGCMAYSTIPRCLTRIHRFIDDYRLSIIADNSTQDMTISNALDAIKQAVLKFVNLENKTKPEAWFSDIDNIVSEYCIIHTVEPEHALLKDFPLESMVTMARAYQVLLDHVLSFLYAMDQAYQLNKSCISANPISGFRTIFGPTWLTMRMETRARLVSAQLTVWDEVEETVKKCRTWAETKLGLADKAITLSRTEYEDAKNKVKTIYEESRRISGILEDKQPFVRFKIHSARGLAMTQWLIFNQLPNPFAVLYEGESKKSETGIALNTVDPDWQHSWATLKLGNAESKSPSTLPMISVFHGVSEEKRIDPKYLIGKTECVSVDKKVSGQSNHHDTPELRFKGHSLFEPFSGDVQLDLSHPSQGTITARIEWEGLSNLVRKEKLQLREFLAANPRYLFLFPEEVEQYADAAALTASQVISGGRPTEQDSLQAFLTLPKDWRLRGVPKAYYIDSKILEDVDKMKLDLGERFPPVIEKRIGKDGRVYFVNHETRTTSWYDPRFSR